MAKLKWAAHRVWTASGAITCGVVLVSSGVWMVFPPAGLITAGVLLIAGALIVERGASDEQ